ncbi:unnamed protein product [Discosporangium mesarthrocarpum]
MESIIENLAGKSPPWLAKFLRAFAPFASGFFVVMNLVGPYIIAFYRAMYKVYKLLPKNVLGMIWGLLLCFFGGFFQVTIAAIEAFNMTGGEKVYLCLSELAQDVKAFNEASAIDNKKDDDADGIPDVDQISAEQLVTRKTALLLKVIDPDRATGAVTVFFNGYMGVLVVLKFKFARTVALAVSIGNYMRPMAAWLLGPGLAFVIPKDYHHWIASLINYFCKLVAMTIAWWIQRLISTVQSAIKGGILFARHLIAFLTDTVEWLNVKHEDTYIDEVIGWVLAFCGAYFQIRSGWDLPFLVDLVLWPVYIIEGFLTWSVTWMET